MCGIAGYRSPAPLPKETWHSRLKQAASRMALRGPDDHGIFTAPGIGLVHQRLSIIDLAGGHQPMQDSATGAVIIYNGELYNFRELRSLLIMAGHCFQTESDTEVLLKSYLEWGEQCLARLNGMFAFAIYTPSDNTLFLARDRLGIKPLFWAEQQNTFCFASSVRALLELLPQVPALNAAAISHYLSTIRINLGAATLLDGINLLEPGHWMRIAPSGERQSAAYWSAPCIPSGEKPVLTMEQAGETLMPLLADAVKSRLISDVPLGGFLSGGLDSTIIAMHASALSNHHYHAYNVGYPQDNYHEFPYAKEAAEAYSMSCKRIELQAADYPDLWKFLIGCNGLPLTTPNEVPIYMLSKALRQEYTVALSGEGADEIFGGYTIPYFAAYDYDRASRVPPSTPSPLDAAILRGYGQNFLPDLASQHILLNAWQSPAEKAAWLHPDVVQGLDGDRQMRNFYEGLYNRNPEASTLDRIMHAHLRINLEGLLLRVDSSSMAASVEARVPFTDHRLVEFAFSLPDHFRLHWRSEQARTQGKALNVLEIVQQDLIESKIALRNSYKGTVPDSILNRPKMSFPVPVFDWMNDWMKPMVKAIVADSPLRDTLFNPIMIEAWINDQIAVHPMKLWPIVNLCLWEQTIRPR